MKKSNMKKLSLLILLFVTSPVLASNTPTCVPPVASFCSTDQSYHDLVMQGSETGLVHSYGWARLQRQCRDDVTQYQADTIAYNKCLKDATSQVPVCPGGYYLDVSNNCRPSTANIVPAVDYSALSAQASSTIAASTTVTKTIYVPIYVPTPVTSTVKAPSKQVAPVVEQDATTSVAAKAVVPTQETVPQRKPSFLEGIINWLLGLF